MLPKIISLVCAILAMGFLVWKYKGTELCRP